MNEKSRAYWQAFWGEKKAPNQVTAWQFGANPDHLLHLVQMGIKTATCSGHVFYEIEKEPLPQVGDYSIILNSKDEPKAIIQTTHIDIVPMNEVPESFARAEGEGDLSYEYWRREHINFFTKALKEFHREFQENMLVVCERFQLVHSLSEDVVE
ncbi:ASCH domain-containing protein [Bacillus sp. NPDC077027]|uniref:ASCH domain-containing protein n=1 Tax=Bacillus sp. NPDC077027 TaxID=3390548 RepID=UPI003D055F2A